MLDVVYSLTKPAHKLTYHLYNFIIQFHLQILEEMLRKGKLDNLHAIDLSHTVSLSEAAIHQLIRAKGPQLEGLMVAGKPKLAEQFFLNVIPFLQNIRYVRKLIIL